MSNMETTASRHLRGMFAFAIWDRSRRRLFIARDRLGIKPLYYRYEGNTLLFGSEIKTILAYPGVKPEFNHGTLAEYLAFGYIAGEESMYAGIRKLMPGHILTVDEHGQLGTSSYWDLDVRVDDGDRSSEYYVSRYRELLEECVSSHLMSDVPLGVFLSGGLDSSAVAALTTKIRKEPIETFSVGYGEEAYSELPYARTIAEHLKSKHHEVRLSRDEFFQTLPRLIWHEDEPIVWPSSVALYFVARLARERVTVVLTGEGSDETLAGYTRYPWTLLNSRMDRVYRKLTPAVLRGMLRKGINSFPLSAASKRKLEHTFLVRDGASWPSFYFDNFYSAFSAADQDELLTSEAKQRAGDAYAGSMKRLESFFGRPPAPAALHRHQDLSGRTADEAGPDEHGRFHRKPRALSRPSPGRVQREHTCEIRDSRNGGKVHSEVRSRGPVAQVNCASAEDGISHALGLLACGILAG